MAIGNIPFIISQRIKDVSESEIYDDNTKVKIMLELSKLNLEILDLYETNEDKGITYEDRESICENDNLSQEEVDFWNQSDDPLNMREVQDAIYEKRDLKARGII